MVVCITRAEQKLSSILASKGSTSSKGFDYALKDPWSMQLSSPPKVGKICEKKKYFPHKCLGSIPLGVNIAHPIWNSLSSQIENIWKAIKIEKILLFWSLFCSYSSSKENKNIPVLWAFFDTIQKASSLSLVGRFWAVKSSRLLPTEGRIQHVNFVPIGRKNTFEM